jgi:hypothetical protein
MGTFHGRRVFNTQKLEECEDGRYVMRNKSAPERPEKVLFRRGS